MSICYIGFTTSPIVGWKDYIDRPVPPANYKKEEVIAEWTEQAVKKQEERAAKTAPLSSIHSYCLWVASMRDPELVVKPEAKDIASLALRLSEGSRPSVEGPIRLVGFDVERFLRTLYCEVGRFGVSGPPVPKLETLEVLLDFSLDPYRHLVPEWERNDVSCLTLCRLMGSPLTETSSADPKALALAARAVATRANLL